jgi:steroid delta-isomerase-like uncharacterized protein
MSTENKALVRRWFEEVWSKGRTDAIDEMLASDAIIRGLGPDLRGPEEFKPFHAVYRAAFPDITIRMDDMVAEGDIVAARWSGTGTHRGDSLGFPATGRQVNLTGMVFARVKNGKLVEGWNVFNQLEMLQQCGIVALPAPG